MKYVIINGRDLYSKTGQKAVQDVQKETSTVVSSDAKLYLDVKKLIFAACRPDGDCKLGRSPMDEVQDAQAFGEFWQKFNNMDHLTLPLDLLREIDSLIQRVLSTYQSYQEKLRKAYDQVRNGRQLAVSYQVVRRPDTGNDDHRAEIIFDYGLTDRITWMWNASGNFRDRKKLANISGGRLATEFKGNLTPESREPLGRAPVTLSFSGETKWMEMMKPQYTFQARLSIPLGVGVDFPIACRFANRRDQIDQNDSEARLGLTVDVGRLVQLFR